MILLVSHIVEENLKSTPVPSGRYTGVEEVSTPHRRGASSLLDGISSGLGAVYC
jgi:hypothetical protein